MTTTPQNSDAIYELILDQGHAARDRYYAALRRIGITPTPADKKGFLYAPNPVVLSRDLVESITTDLQKFCDARLAETPDAAAIAEKMPAKLRPIFGDLELAARLRDDLKRTAPFACLDCFLVEGQDGLEPAYLEWQTFPTYPATAIYCLQTIEESFDGLSEAGVNFSPRKGESLGQLRHRVTQSLTRGVEDDPRQGVIVDFEPKSQETSYEFDFERDLSGGPKTGLGIIDPREVVFQDGKPAYLRDGQLIPIKSVFSRLVHGDIERKLLPACSLEETQKLQRFFSESDVIDWRVHPLHFHYGSKGDLPQFREQGLSKYIPACEPVTEELIAIHREAGTQELKGQVQKPIDGHGGRDVIADPKVHELELGAILQDRIIPAASHRTLDGAMTPEMRVMAIPDEAGRLECAAVFTRVKAPSEFRSNASEIARCNIPGTGEGYAVLVD